MTTEAGAAAPAAPSGEQANPAAAQPNAATTDPATGAGEGGEASQDAPKTFTQAELDDIVRREKSKAEAKAERRVLRTLERLQPQPAAVPQAAQQTDDKPTRAQYATDEAYVDALTDWKLDQRDRRQGQERQQQQAQSLTQKTEGVYAQAEKLPGFDREAFDALPLTRPIVEALIDSEHAPKLMLYMASHPEDIERISRLSPARQAAELGKLEDKAVAAPTAKTSKAPDPVNPTARGSTSIVDLANASQAEYEAQRKKQGARWAR